LGLLLPHLWYSDKHTLV